MSKLKKLGWIYDNLSDWVLETLEGMTLTEKQATMLIAKAIIKVHGEDADQAVAIAEGYGNMDGVRAEWKREKEEDQYAYSKKVWIELNKKTLEIRGKKISPVRYIKEKRKDSKMYKKIKKNTHKTKNQKEKEKMKETGQKWKKSKRVGTYWSARHNCHRGTVHVFDSSLLHFYGGGLHKGVYIPTRGKWLVISAIECDIGTVKTNYTPRYIKQWANLPIIQILIPDHSAPELPKRFWRGLTKELIWMAEGDDLNVLVMCQGGHGRTGTILGIMAGLLLREENPVQFVRDNYCHLAVETRTQEKYVAEITNTDIVASTGGHKLKQKDVSLDEEEEERQAEFLEELTDQSHEDSSGGMTDEDIEEFQKKHGSIKVDAEFGNDSSETVIIDGQSG